MPTTDYCNQNMFGFQDDEIDENMPVKAITSIENLGRAGRRLDQGLYWSTWECNYLVELYHDFLWGGRGLPTRGNGGSKFHSFVWKEAYWPSLWISLDGTQGVDFIPKARIDQTIRIGEMVLIKHCNYMCSFFCCEHILVIMKAIYHSYALMPRNQSWLD